MRLLFSVIVLFSFNVLANEKLECLGHTTRMVLEGGDNRKYSAEVFEGRGVFERKLFSIPTMTRWSPAGRTLFKSKGKILQIDEQGKETELKKKHGTLVICHNCSNKPFFLIESDSKAEEYYGTTFYACYPI